MSEPPRRKGPKGNLKLSSAAFTPQNSSAEESFPSATHPEEIVDASVRDLAQWATQASGELAARAAKKVVYFSRDGTLNGLQEKANAAGVEILSVQIPFDLENGPPVLPQAQDLPNGAQISLATSFSRKSDAAAAGLEAALRTGCPLDIEVVLDLEAEDDWEELGKAVTNAVDATKAEQKIVFDLVLPSAKLLSKTAYERRVAALALLPNSCFKLLPLDWDLPKTPFPGLKTLGGDEEWKQLMNTIRMYLNSALEPFGFGGILFGTAPSSASSATISAGSWYELLHTLFTDPHSPGLRVGQDAVDEFFFKNALAVYGPQGAKEGSA